MFYGERITIIENGVNMYTIFIHGLGQTPSSWDQVISFLEVEQIGCPDLFSFAKGRATTYENMYQAFRNYCSCFDEPLGLCGISLGAVLALNYTLEFPQKVASLVLIAPQFKTPQLLLRFQTALFRIMPDSVFRETGIDKESIILLQKSMLKLNFTPMLNKITCPTLIICGQNDKINQKAAKELAGQLSNARFELIENAGHEVNIDTPKELAEILNSNFKTG